MTKAKWCKFYPSDFLAGVHNLTGFEIAAYIIVLCELYDAEGMCRRDDTTMAKRGLMRPIRFTRALEGLIRKRKVECVEGMLTNKRVTEEIENRIQMAIAKQAQRPVRGPSAALPRPNQPGKPNDNNENLGRVLAYKENREDKKEDATSAISDRPADRPVWDGPSGLEGFRARLATAKPKRGLH